MAASAGSSVSTRRPMATPRTARTHFLNVRKGHSAQIKLIPANARNSQSNLFSPNRCFQLILRCRKTTPLAMRKIIATARSTAVPSKNFSTENAGLPSSIHCETVRDPDRDIQAKGIHIAFETPSIFFRSIQNRQRIRRLQESSASWRGLFYALIAAGL